MSEQERFRSSGSPHAMPRRRRAAVSGARGPQKSSRARGSRRMRGTSGPDGAEGPGPSAAGSKVGGAFFARTRCRGCVSICMRKPLGWSGSSAMNEHSCSLRATGSASRQPLAAAQLSLAEAPGRLSGSAGLASEATA
eukprot:11022611-Heterocapsa_arctica.AAC.1